jgi:hypothetical protein
MKLICLILIDDLFVGSKTDLEDVKLKITNMDNAENTAIQYIMRIVYDYVEVDVPTDRNAWLFNV